MLQPAAMQQLLGCSRAAVPWSLASASTVPAAAQHATRAAVAAAAGARRLGVLLAMGHIIAPLLLILLLGQALVALQQQ